MNNPLLRPNDPRFQPLPIEDAGGQNRFGDAEQAAGKSADKQPASVFASPATTAEQPYEPRYETSESSRGKLLLGLALIGMAGMTLGVLSVAGLLDAGWIFPLCAAVAAGAAVFLGYSDLREMALGARDDSGRLATRAAMWLGLLGLFGCAALVAAMTWLELGMFPKL